MKRRTLLNYMPFMALALVEPAQAAPNFIAKKQSALPLQPAIAAPTISAKQLVEALLQTHFVPNATALLHAANALRDALATHSGTTNWMQHRPLWVTTMLAWEHLVAIAIFPMSERRSARAIDFWPTRPPQIEQHLLDDLPANTPVDKIDSLAASARGLPALEWLLWRTQGEGNIPTYASLLAQHVAYECQAILTGIQALAATRWNEANAWAVYGQWFGQALGGLDQLRIKKMVADSRGKATDPWIRGVSGQTANAWRAQANALEIFLVGSPTSRAATQAATPGYPVPGSLNSLLLGRGHLEHSSMLLRNTGTMQALVQQARPDKTRSVRATQAALKQISAHLNRLAEAELQITLGFTDADGD